MQKPTAQQIAQTIARNAVNETNEVLKSAKEQIAPVPRNSDTPQQSVGEKQEPPKPKNLSFLNEYKNELNQIRRDNLFKELQEKIAQGEEIPLENYVNELSYEQKDVLKAQMEVIKSRKDQEENATKRSGVREVVSKKGRQMFNKIKKRNEQHVEIRQPPSS